MLTILQIKGTFQSCGEIESNRRFEVPNERGGDSVAVNVEIDGIYCPKCKQMHPTLYWHDKYDNYLDFTLWRESYSISLMRLGKVASQEVVDIEYEKNLDIRDLKLSKKQMQCAICAGETFFISKRTSNAVCSDECRYKDKNECEM